MNWPTSSWCKLKMNVGWAYSTILQWEHSQLFFQIGRSEVSSHECCERPVMLSSRTLWSVALAVASPFPTYWTWVKSYERKNSYLNKIKESSSHWRCFLELWGPARASEERYYWQTLWRKTGHEHVVGVTLDEGAPNWDEWLLEDCGDRVYCTSILWCSFIFTLPNIS
jgi:hypothetical protein